MAWSKTAVTYGYKVEISFESIIDKICENIIDQPDDWEFDGEKLVIRGSIHTGANIWSCRATMESPAEWDAELNTNIEDEDIQGIVVDMLNNIKRNEIAVDVEMDDSSDWDYDDESDDDNDAYDRWRDAYYDREYTERNEE